MKVLNELRYINSNFKFLDVDDIIVIFKGTVYTISSEEEPDNNTLYLLKQLCDTFPSMKKFFYDKDGNLIQLYLEGNNLIDAIYEHFENFPKVIIGTIDYDENDKLILDIHNDAYNVLSSPEFNQFLKSDQAHDFGKIIINGKEITANDADNKPHKIKLANPLYHGTIYDNLKGIFSKGLRKIQSNSIFTVNNDGFVFLTSEFSVAENYANMYSRTKSSRMAILKINSNYIDEDKVVLDYDFVKEFTEPGKNDPYVNSKPYYNAFVGKIADNNKRYGTKFGKIGYRGIIMPKAIEGVYLFDKAGIQYEYYTTEEIYNLLFKNESKYYVSNKINENSMKSGKIKLYHGTTLHSLYDIIQDETIDAYNGEQHGETNGYNWFSTTLTNSFDRGAVFSIEINLSDFQNEGFMFMNKTEVVNRNKINNIQKYNFKIERINGINCKQLKTIFKKYGNNIYEFYKYIINLIGDSVDVSTIDSPIVIQLLKQVADYHMLHNEGLIENVEHVNEIKTSEISLKSFKIQNDLNNKIWVNGKINSRVRLRLLDIADDFMDDLSIKWVKPIDIILTGSIANYNWSKYSDIDLHIIIDYNNVYNKKEFVEDYFNSKKELWKRDHDELKIYGFPVEIYVQDKNEEVDSNGVYSLNKNEWIKEPKDMDDVKLNEKYIKSQAAKYINQIEKYETKLKSEKDSYKVEKIGISVKKLLDKIKGIRKESLKRSGEMSSGNILYKIIRRMGYLDKIWEIINDSYNKSKTIN